MKKNNNITDKLGKASADMFFEIGDSVNLVNLLRVTPKNYKKISIKSDYEAMKSDWDAINKEVYSAFERYDREHREHELINK